MQNVCMAQLQLPSQWLSNCSILLIRTVGGLLWLIVAIVLTIMCCLLTQPRPYSRPLPLSLSLSPTPSVCSTLQLPSSPFCLRLSMCPVSISQLDSQLQVCCYMWLLAVTIVVFVVVVVVVHLCNYSMRLLPPV